MSKIVHRKELMSASAIVQKWEGNSPIYQAKAKDSAKLPPELTSPNHGQKGWTMVGTGWRELVYANFSGWPSGWYTYDDFFRLKESVKKQNANTFRFLARRQPKGRSFMEKHMSCFPGCGVSAPQPTRFSFAEAAD